MYVHSKVLTRCPAAWCYNVTEIWRSNEGRCRENGLDGNEYNQHRLHSRSSQWSIRVEGHTANSVEQTNGEQKETLCLRYHSRHAGESGITELIRL